MSSKRMTSVEFNECVEPIHKYRLHIDKTTSANSELLTFIDLCDVLSDISSRIDDFIGLVCYQYDHTYGPVQTFYYIVLTHIIATIKKMYVDRNHYPRTIYFNLADIFIGVYDGINRISEEVPAEKIDKQRQNVKKFIRCFVEHNLSVFKSDEIKKLSVEFEWDNEFSADIVKKAEEEKVAEKAAAEKVVEKVAEKVAEKVVEKKEEEKVVEQKTSKKAEKLSGKQKLQIEAKRIVRKLSPDAIEAGFSSKASDKQIDYFVKNVEEISRKKISVESSRIKKVKAVVDFFLSMSPAQFEQFIGRTSNAALEILISIFKC